MNLWLPGEKEDRKDRLESGIDMYALLFLKIDNHQGLTE